MSSTLRRVGGCGRAAAAGADTGQRGGARHMIDMLKAEESAIADENPAVAGARAALVR
jgi:hypothetical protein